MNNKASCRAGADELIALQKKSDEVECRHSTREKMITKDTSKIKPQ